MGRPKAERTKDSLVSLRTFLEVRDALEGYARQERRTPSQMAELLLREAIIARRKRDNLAAADIEGLP